MNRARLDAKLGYGTLMLIQEASTPAPVTVTIKPGVGAPQAVYRALNAQRRELGNQLDQLEGKRRELVNEVRELGQERDGEGRSRAIDGPAKVGIETRITELDKRIADVEKQIAVSDMEVAKAAGMEGAIPPEPPRPPRQGPPEEVFILAGMFIVAVFFPLAIAYSRRIWKRTGTVVSAFPQELSDRLNRLDQAMDSVAIEVERIGEGQRFVTRVMTENGARSVGAGVGVPVARDGER